MTKMPANKNQKPLPPLKKVNINLKKCSIYWNNY